MDLANYIPAIRAAGISFIIRAGAPTGVTAPKGSIYVNLTGSSSSTRMYINSDGATTWQAVTTAG